jgi:hypothetical protein
MAVGGEARKCSLSSDCWPYNPCRGKTGKSAVHSELGIVRARLSVAGGIPNLEHRPF